MHPYNHQSNPVERFHRTLWSLLRAKMANGERDLEKSIPAITLAYNSSIHASTGCSPARGFLGREVEIPHLSLLPKFDNPEQHVEPCGLEEDMDRVWEEMRVADDVRIGRQFGHILQDVKKISRWEIMCMQRYCHRLQIQGNCQFVGQGLQSSTEFLTRR